MKKVLAFLISLNFAVMPAYCTITDDFAEKTLSKSLTIQKYNYVPIADDFAEGLNVDKKINTKPAQIITDTFAESNRNKNVALIKQTPVAESIPKADPQRQFAKKIVVIDNNSAIAVPVKICKTYSTRQKIDEGDYIDFVTTKEVKIKGKTYSAGAPVKARVETISQNGAMGVPADLIISNFSIDSIPLSGEVNKTGANRTLWVRPCVYLLTILFFGSGVLLIPIRGGHAKIRPTETITLYAVN